MGAISGSFVVLSSLSLSADEGRSRPCLASAVQSSWRLLSPIFCLPLLTSPLPQKQKLNFVSIIEWVVYYYVDFFFCLKACYSFWVEVFGFSHIYLSVSMFQGFPWYWHFHYRNLKNVQLYRGHETYLLLFFFFFLMSANCSLPNFKLGCYDSEILLFFLHICYTVICTHSAHASKSSYGSLRRQHQILSGGLLWACF